MRKFLLGKIVIVLAVFAPSLVMGAAPSCSDTSNNSCSGWDFYEDTQLQSGYGFDCPANYSQATGASNNNPGALVCQCAYLSTYQCVGYYEKGTACDTFSSSAPKVERRNYSHTTISVATSYTNSSRIRYLYKNPAPDSVAYTQMPVNGVYNYDIVVDSASCSTGSLVQNVPIKISGGYCDAEYQLVNLCCENTWQTIGSTGSIYYGRHYKRCGTINNKMVVLTSTCASSESGGPGTTGASGRNWSSVAFISSSSSPTTSDFTSVTNEMACEPLAYCYDASTIFYHETNNSVYPAKEFAEGCKLSEVDCPYNYYKGYDANGYMKCIACGENSTSPAGSTSSSQCSCKANFYGTNGSCTACGAHSTSTAGSTSASQCLCNAGYTGSNGHCTACADGTYKSSSGSADCTTCTSPKTCSGTAQTTFSCVANYYKNGSDCTSCGSNATSPAGSTSASQCSCKANYYGTNGNCTSCGSNATSSAGSTSSSQCSCKANYYGTNGNCTQCGENSTSSAGSTSSSQCSCDAGYYGSNGSCTQCPGFAKQGVYNCVHGTSSAGTTNITGCFIASGSTWTDSVGDFVLTGNCDYSATQSGNICN